MKGKADEWLDRYKIRLMKEIHKEGVRLTYGKGKYPCGG